MKHFLIDGFSGNLTNAKNKGVNRPEVKHSLNEHTCSKVASGTPAQCTGKVLAVGVWQFSLFVEHGPADFWLRSLTVLVSLLYYMDYMDPNSV